MDLRLRLLDTFHAAGSDGADYKVCAYDRLAPDPALPDGGEHWESTGEVELRLADGRAVTVQPDGSGRIAGSSVQLSLPAEAVH